MNRLSACLITLNEEHNLPRALASLAGIADEIVVVDCGSQDRTQEIAREHGAKVITRTWTNFAEQKNAAVAAARHDWILSLDADEELSPELRKSLLAWKEKGPVCEVYELARRAWYVGGWIRHSGWYPDRQRRLFRRDAASFSGIVHESLQFKGEPGRLGGDLLHYTIRSFAEHEEKVERYTTLAAQQMYAAGKRSWRAAMWLATPWNWFKSFALQLGFLDGSRGWVISRMAARSTWLKFKKLGSLIETERRAESSNAMRVLYVDLEREWRGGQSQALLTLRGLQERGHEIALLAAQDSPLAKRAAEAGITIYQVARFGLRAWAALAIRSLIASGRFELVHLNEPHALTAAWMARAHKRVPLLLSRRIGFPLQKNAVSQARLRAVTRFMANSKDVAQSLIDSGIAVERISIVNEGVEISPLRTPEQRSSARKHWGVRENEFLFGCVSVFVPEKGQRHLIEALPLVRTLYPEARLLLAGDGACRAELETLTKQLGQTEAVLFPGFVKDVEQVYAALDAFVFPSEFEGLGTALQAAMAAGLPCISTKRGALREVVDAERTALVAEPAGKQFAALMVRVINDEALRKSLSQAGRQEVAQRFSAARMVENTIRVYEDALRRAKQ